MCYLMMCVNEITFYRILDILYQNQICQLICVAIFMQRHVIAIKAATSEMLENVFCADDQEKEIHQNQLHLTCSSSSIKLGEKKAIKKKAY